MTRLSSSALPSLSLTVAFGSILAGLGRLLPGGGFARGRCPKINLLVRTTNRDVIAFYERLGFSISDVTTLGKRLS